jgi:hypothetical protein
MWVMALSLLSHNLVAPFAHPKLQMIERVSLSAATTVIALSLAIPLGIGNTLLLELAIGIIQIATLIWLAVLAVPKGTFPRILHKCSGICELGRSKLASVQEPLVDVVAAGDEEERW